MEFKIHMFDGEIMPMVKKVDKGTGIIVYGPDSCSKNMATGVDRSHQKLT